MTNIVSKKLVAPFAAITVYALLLTPFLAGAQGIINDDLSTDEGFGGFINALSRLINDFLIPFLIALAVLAFIYGVFQYFIAGGADEEKRAAGRSLMLYALLGFVAIVVLWGIVNFLIDAFGFDAGSDVLPPGTPGVGG